MQAFEVAKALKEAEPGLSVEFHFSESLGDKNLTDPLWKMPGKGVFTEDLTSDLIAGRADMVVHSWKDLPVEEKPETEIAATLPRADARDLLLFKKSSRPRCRPGAQLRIFSSSPRREYNLKPFLREHLPGSPGGIEFLSVRGNIPTRLRKLLETPEVDGLVVAKAAIDRLLGTTEEEFASARRQVGEALAACDWMVLPLSVNPAAAAQGALAIEIRRDREDLKKLLAKIHDARTFTEAVREREILSSHGGGCHQKIGATVLHRHGSDLRFVRGLTEKGVELREKILANSFRGDVIPLRSDWLFERRPLPDVSLPAGTSAVFLAHEKAWPGSLVFHGILWTAGLTTWKKMAQKGHWVNGSSEGLGESEDPRIERLAGALSWASLTHSLSPGPVRGVGVVTYELVPRANSEAPPESGTLYWSSATLFHEALRRWPHLAGRDHACGPGKTWDILKDRVKNLHLRWPLEEN
ncbi:MAG: hydroxymethylbilane synthase [Bdellovibrionaceae bacterium]|nr:hydroxymethylbilane synthase [Pseudobdellovibrionaceae bacterium]MBX3034125.1 hydroxymethylbilane synthase [Pseudobdellovibrionaceae bacterium]